MRQNLFAWLVGILILTIVAGYVDLAGPLDVFGHKIRTVYGLDLQGGIQLVLKAEPRGNQTSITPEQLQAARDILEQRANGTGASEPVVQTAGNDRILVELPGITNLEDATKIIQETAFLEFISSGDTPLSKDTLVCTEKGGCPRPELQRVASGTSNTSTPGAGTPVVTSTTTVSNTGAIAQASPTAQASATPATVYKTVIDGGEIDGNKVTVVSNNGLPQVSFTLKGDGPNKLAQFTGSNINKYMPIVLDNRVIDSPVIKGMIPAGNGVIEGLTRDEANRLAVQLKYGALPVGLVLQESRKISATLGQEAIARSVVAGIIGLGLVALFMLIYYRLPGALADVALVIYSVITFAVFKAFPITLTLAGIAGFILSIGMAVDANVLIFSRLKEELRLGKTLPAAVEAGFDHAWPSIRDSNSSTIMTCLILYWFGSTFGGASIIKGFALTLLIGVIISLFTAITVTRTFLRAIVRSGLAKNRWAFDIETPRPEATPTTTPVAEA